MKVLITGANGFIGSHVLQALYSQVLDVKAALRHPSSALPLSVPTEIVGTIHKNTNWDKALENVDTVIHLAAHAHAANPREEKPFFEVNFEGTKQLAERARAHGIKKFIYLSSVAAVRRISEEPIHEEMKPEPETPYAKSKYLAEEAVKDVFSKSDSTFTILRAPAVFGVGCRGNLKSLFSLVSRNIPIPLSQKPTIRSIMAVEDLSNLLTQCIEREETSNQIFHVADSDNLPLNEVINIVGEELGKQPTTVKLPRSVWNTIEFFSKAGDSLGLLLPVTPNQLAVLHEPLLVSSKKLQHALGWKSSLSLPDALAQWVRKERMR